MDLNTMKTNLSEIRAELIGKKAVYEQQRANAEKTLKDFKTTLEAIKEEDINFLIEHGFNAGLLQDIDVERLSADEKYLETVTANVEDLGQKLYDQLLKEVS